MMNNSILTKEHIENLVKQLLLKYHGESAILFGSYARGDCTNNSDIDVIVYGGKNFRPFDIFAFGEDLREMTNKDADVFEISEVNQNSDFYKNVLNEGIRIS